MRVDAGTRRASDVSHEDGEVAQGAGRPCSSALIVGMVRAETAADRLRIFMYVQMKLESNKLIGFETSALLNGRNRRPSRTLS